MRRLHLAQTETQKLQEKAHEDEEAMKSAQAAAAAAAEEDKMARAAGCLKAADDLKEAR